MRTSTLLALVSTVALCAAAEAHAAPGGYGGGGSHGGGQGRAGGYSGGRAGGFAAPGRSGGYGYRGGYGGYRGGYGGYRGYRGYGGWGAWGYAYPWGYGYPLWTDPWLYAPGWSYAPDVYDPGVYEPAPYDAAPPPPPPPVDAEPAPEPEPDASSGYGAPPAAEAPAAAEKSFAVYFALDRADLNTDARRVISEAERYAASRRAERIEVVGHTDTAGAEGHNDTLSQRRAEAVRDELIRDGAPTGRVSVNWTGERDLAVQTGADVREPSNRRATILVFAGGAQDAGDPGGEAQEGGADAPR